jgi:ribonuclease Z
MTFSVTVLGSGSALPTLNRNPSAHLLNANERLFLIDCAEGTQVQLRKSRVHLQRIKAIFITHLHGDHFYGLIGLLTTFHLLGRREELHLYGPDMLEDIINLQLKASRTTLIYPVIFHVLTGDVPVTILENDFMTVESFPLVHSVPTWGFLFREKRQLRRIRKEIVDGLNVPVEEFLPIKQGKDFTDTDGIVHPNASITADPPKPKSYAYCTDTVYDEKIVPWIQGADLLYHETTFMEDMAQMAKDKLHATAREAAVIAQKAGVHKLLIGHFSARYDDLGPLLAEAKAVFPETFLAEEGLTFKV